MFNQRNENRVLEINLTVPSVKNTIKKENSHPTTVGTEPIYVSRRLPGSATRNKKHGDNLAWDANPSSKAEPDPRRPIRGACDFGRRLHRHAADDVTGGFDFVLEYTSL